MPHLIMLSEPPQLQFAAVAGCVKNSQFDRVKLEKVHDWHGHFVASPPEYIYKEALGFFRHNAEPPVGLPAIIGSKAAVIYRSTGFGYPPQGYLVAWYKAQNSDEHKVYVQVEEISKLMKVDWKEIEQRLDASTNESHAIDPHTRATASAKIVNLSTRNFAAVVANIGVKPIKV